MIYPTYHLPVHSCDTLPQLYYEGKPALPPQMDDLNRLYKMITESFSLTVLEFGCGYSTFVISQALEFNRKRWEALEKKPKVRNSKMFKGYVVDTNEMWLSEVKNKLQDVRSCIDINAGIPSLEWKQEYEMYFILSRCIATTYNDQLCHKYLKLPDIVPDFIYLDGPDPMQVQGEINSLSFQCPERTPMAADILLMEPTLIPGTTILIDGRTNNARFLAKNLKREWEFYPYSMRMTKAPIPTGEDHTYMILNEPRLGKINVVGRDIWNQEKNEFRENA